MALAGGAFVRWPLILWLLLGSIAMRGAGCVFNDIVDRDLDARVARTAARPLASGAMSVKTAWAWLNNGESTYAARSAWVATAKRPFAEQADAWNRLALRGAPDPLEDGFDDFAEVSKAVLVPLMAHLEGGA